MSTPSYRPGDTTATPLDLSRVMDAEALRGTVEAYRDYDLTEMPEFAVLVERLRRLEGCHG
jgi:hypothetical protein